MISMASTMNQVLSLVSKMKSDLNKMRIKQSDQASRMASQESQIVQLSQMNATCEIRERELTKENESLRDKLKQSRSLLALYSQKAMESPTIQLATRSDTYDNSSGRERIQSNKRNENGNIIIHTKTNSEESAKKQLMFSEPNENSNTARCTKKPRSTSVSPAL